MLTLMRMYFSVAVRSYKDMNWVSCLWRLRGKLLVSNTLLSGTSPPLLYPSTLRQDDEESRRLKMEGSSGPQHPQKVWPGAQPYSGIVFCHGLLHNL